MSKEGWVCYHRILGFIKYDVSDSVLFSIICYTFIAFVFGVVAKEYARGGSKIKFGFGVGS